jgi:hypothetical protein
VTEPAAAKPCIWCGAKQEDPNALRCASCHLWLERRQCGVCGEPISPDASYCNACKSLQTTLYKNCRVCQARLPKNADRCNACTSLQSWRRLVPVSQTTIAMLAALLSAMSALLPHVSDALHRNSDTSFIVTSATGDAIVLAVTNTGRSASVLQHFDLEFGKLPLEPVELRVIPEDRNSGKTYIPPGSSIVHLQASGINVRGGESKQRIRELLSLGRDVTLTVSIKESDDRAEGPWTKVASRMPASFIRDFILGRIADE